MEEAWPAREACLPVPWTKKAFRNLAHLFAPPLVQGRPARANPVSGAGEAKVALSKSFAAMHLSFILPSDKGRKSGRARITNF